MSLHWRKQLFVAETLAHPELDATDVARRCGYTGAHVKQRAYALMRDPEVKAAVEHGRQQILAKVELTAQDVIKDILAARQRCVENGDSAWAMAGRLRCNELLGRYLKMWEEEKVEVNVGVELLAERLRQARDQVGRPAEVEAPQVEVKALPARAEPVEREPIKEEVAPQIHSEPQKDWVEKYVS